MKNVFNSNCVNNSELRKLVLLIPSFYLDKIFRADLQLKAQPNRGLAEPILGLAKTEKANAQKAGACLPEMVNEYPPFGV